MPIINDGGYGNGMYMPVAPINYGGNGGGMGDFGNGWWIILLLLCGWGGMGGYGGFGGFGGGLGIDFPWILNGQNQINANTNNGFRDAMLNDGITSIGDKVVSGFGDVNLGIAGLGRQICETGGNIVGALNNGFSNAEIAANSRAMSNMQQLFNVTTGIGDLKYTVAQENCQDRYEAQNNTRDIIDAINVRAQGIENKLCQLELDNYKTQLASAQRDNAALQNQVILATERADRTAQTGTIIDGVYNRLATCPVDTTPVYGRQPIFTCPQRVDNYGCNGGYYGNVA